MINNAEGIMLMIRWELRYKSKNLGSVHDDSGFLWGKFTSSEPDGSRPRVPFLIQVIA